MEHGWWKTPSRSRPEHRLKTIFDGVTELIEEYEPNAVALEESFVGVDARTALSVGQARGVILVAAASLGIDPGTAACGWGVVQHERDGRLRALEHGWWRTAAGQRPELGLRTIFDGVAGLIAEHTPDAVALEESFVGVDARTALSVGQARGAVLVAAAVQGVECTEYAPARVKQAVCGYGRAEKDQVQRMVKAILGLSEPPKPTHAADALAVAICHALAPPLLKMVG